MRRAFHLYCLLTAFILCGPALAQGQPQLVKTAVVDFGEPFPGGVYKNLNLAAGPNTIDMSVTLGKKPVILFYWIAENPRAARVVQEVQALADELGPDRLAVYAVVFERPGHGAAEIRAGIEEAGVRVPVLVDEGFKLGQQLRVEAVPNISIIDAEGRLRLTNGGGLKQVLEYKMDLEAAIRRVVRTGRLGSYGYLARYYPVNELVGQRCPDFKAPLVTTRVEQRLHSILDDQKLNVLIFWSVDCPHCTSSLPMLNAWLKANPQGVNVVTVAAGTSEAARIKTREFCELSGFVFPTLVDKDSTISALYQVTSTPTILFIRPDGIVDSVMLTNTESFGETIEQKKREFGVVSGS